MSTGYRRIVIIRHGERVDHRFQDEWVEKCFDSDGNYSRQNLNQPASLPMRKGHPQSFIRDSPLTAIGCLQATLRGQGLKKTNVLADNFEVFVSPSLRCVKTASNILKAMNNNAIMCIEPSLFECTNIKWYLNGNMPKWMTTEEFAQAGFNVNLEYEPFILAKDIKEEESMQEYYERSRNVLAHLLNKTGSKDLLIVAHGFSMDALSRKLLRKRPLNDLTFQQMFADAGKVPYCGMMVLEQDENTNNWSILPLPKQLQLTHASAHEFDACKVFCN